MNGYKGLNVKDYERVVQALNSFMNSYDLVPLQLHDGSLLDLSVPQFNFKYKLPDGSTGLLVFYFKKGGRMSLVPQGKNIETSKAMAWHIATEL